MGSFPKATRFATRLIIVGVVMAGLAFGALVAHKYRKAAVTRGMRDTGEAAYERGAFTQAAVDLGRYLTVERTDVDVLMKYADAQMRRRPQQQQSIQQAVAALETVLRITRGEPEASQELCRLYLLLQWASDAERVANAWHAVYPEDETAVNFLAEAQVRQRREDGAAAVLQRFVRTHPEAVTAASQLANIELRHLKVSGNDEDALAYVTRTFDDIVNANASSIVARIERARFSLLAHDTARARSDASAAEELGPPNTQTALSLGQLFIELGLYSRASTQFTLARELAPTGVLAYLVSGRLAFNTQDIAGGAAIADEIVAAADGMGEQRFDVLPLAAELYLAGGRSAEAVTCIEQIRGAGVPTEVLLYLEGQVAVSQGRTYEGISLLARLIRLKPRFAKGHLALARAYLRVEDTRRALSSLSEFERLSTGARAEISLQLVAVYSSMGLWGDAKRIATSAAMRAPYNVWAQWLSLRTSAFAARFAGAQVDLAAIRVLKEQTDVHAERNPEDARLQNLRALLTAWSGDYGGAIRMLLAARGAFPDADVITEALVSLYAEAGDYENAISECSAAMEEAPADQRLAWHVRLVELLIASGDFDGAIREAEVVATRPAGAARSTALLKCARQLMGNDRVEPARDFLTRLAREDENDVPSRLLLLSMYRADGGLHQAHELIAQLKWIQGDDGLDWRLWQAKIWLQDENWRENRRRIEALLDECLSSEPSWDEALIALALLNERSGEYSQAADVYERVSESRQADPAFLRRYLAVAARSGRWDQVGRLLGGLSEDDPVAWPYRIDLAERRGDVEQVVMLLQRKMQEDPTDVASRLKLAAIKLVYGKRSEAEQLFLEVEGIDPNAPELLHARVDDYLKLGEWAKAIAFCDQALVGPIGNAGGTLRATAYILRATALSAQGNVGDAERDLRSIIAMGDQEWTVRAYLALGSCHIQDGSLDRAIDAFDEAVRVLPASATFEIRRAKVAILLSGDARQQQDGAVLLARLLEERPTDEALCLWRAERAARESPEEAEYIYEEIVSRSPAMTEAFLRLAQIASRRGQRDRALEWIDKGLRVDRRSSLLLILKHDLLKADQPGRAAFVAEELVSAARASLAAYPDDTAVPLAAIAALLSSPDPAQLNLAVSLLEHVAERNSGNPDIIGELSLAYARVGRFAEAKDSGTQALERRPDDVGLINNLAWILCELNDDPYAAEPLITGAIEYAVDDPRFPSLLDTSGVVMYRLGLVEQSRKRWEDSRTYLQQCVRHPAATPATLASATFHLARTLAELGEPRGERLLGELLSDEGRRSLLDSSSREEAERLLQRLQAE